MDELLIPGWEDDEYRSFVDKFKSKKTTDDCYTPPNVYDAVAAYVAERYALDPAVFLRPFYPGGDYEREHYPPGAVVVDNPPFSILSQILRFYTRRGIRFFLFAPTLTLFSQPAAEVTTIPLGVTVTYANGAEVNTSFVTNLEPPTVRVRSDPELYSRISSANAENLAALHKSVPKYTYPDQILTASMVARFSRYGVAYELPAADCLRISGLDSQRSSGTSIFGSGWLLSTSAAAEKAAAEKAAAEKAAAEKANITAWRLSETELAMIAYLDKRRKTEEPDP